MSDVVGPDTMRLTAYRLDAPLREPYRLSFGTLTSFETLVVHLAGDGRAGLGEITPLPGYSDESIESACAALDGALPLLEAGAAFGAVIEQVSTAAPFVASGLAVAKETWSMGIAAAFERSVERAVPLVALCPGESPQAAADAARRLTDEGYRTLKLKIAGDGVSVFEDIARIRAVAAVIDQDCDLRLDANQRLSGEAADTLVEEISGLPISLLEQPFAPDAWHATKRLAARSAIPIMLDESVNGASDITRAADIGVRHVKLKLCKHPGMAATRDLIQLAQSQGLGVVLGNGVQGPIGNYLEARLYEETNLKMAGEMNGFLKIAGQTVDHGMAVERGRLRAMGVRDAERIIAKAEPVCAVTFDRHRVEPSAVA